MILQRVVLDHFRQFDHQEYEFQPGLNLIKGPNEAGKTTLQEGILFALLGNPRRTILGKRRDRTGQRRSKRVHDYIPWGEHGRFRVTLEFTDRSGRAYRLMKDWGARALCLTDLDTGAEEQDIESAQHTINNMLGYGSMELLQSTVCVEQDAIDDISAGRQEIGDQLQGIFTGGSTDEATVSAVLKDLDENIAEMKRGWLTHAPVNPGPIKRRQDEIAVREQRLSEVRPDVERAEQAKERLIALEARVGELERELSPKRLLRELCDRRLALERDRDEWASREKPLEAKIARIEEAQRDVEQANRDLLAYPRFAAVDVEAEERLTTLRQRVKLLVEDVERQSDRLQTLKVEQVGATTARSGLPVAPVIGAAVGLILLLVGVVVVLRTSDPIGLLMGFVGLVMAAGCMIHLLGASSGRTEADSGAEIASRQADLAETQHRLQDATTQLGEALGALECSTWDEFTKKLGEYRTCLKEQQTAETRHDALLAGQTLEALIEEREGASRRRRDAEEALREPKMQRAMEITALQYEELAQDIEQLEAELGKKEEERREHRALRDVVGHSIEDVHRLEEQKAAAERSLAHLEERLAVCELAREVIEEAKEQTMRSAREELEPRIADHLCRITQGRYARVEADDDLNLRVFSSQKGDWTSPESGGLSRGTVDQLYLAARLALLDLLYRDVKPPLLLDDPFVKFDPRRREQAMALCKEIAGDHQVLLFTCHDDYDSAADWKVELADPAI